MRKENEIKKLKNTLEKVTGEINDAVDAIISAHALDFISGNMNVNEYETNESTFACNVIDTLYWVLGEITTERFLSDAYLNVEKLEEIALKLKMNNREENNIK